MIFGSVFVGELYMRSIILSDRGIATCQLYQLMIKATLDVMKKSKEVLSTEC